MTELDKDFFNLDEWKSTSQRIDMVLHPDCPIDTMYIVANHDTDMEVLKHVPYNKKCPDEVVEIISSRMNITVAEIEMLKHQFYSDRLTGVTDAFCYAPWNHLSTNANGSIRMCCQMINESDEEDSPSFGTVYKDDGTPLMGTDDIKTNRNARAWKKIRKQMLNGEKPSLCDLCYKEEEQGMSSKRQWTNKLFSYGLDKATIKTQDDGSIDDTEFPIENYDLRFGNKCNLACRSCGPTDSDLWYADWAKVKSDHFTYRDTGEIKIEIDDKGKATVDDTVFKWYEDSLLWKYIIENLHNIKRFYFTGGEPTVNLKHRELLDLLIERGLASEIVLDYNTNMAGLPSSIFAQWKQFKEVHLGMSIDGIFEHFEYIRYPGKWDTVFKNLTRLDNEEGLDNVVATFTTTVSIMNVIHVLDMQWWLLEQNFKRIESFIIMHNLYAPEEFNTQNLPNSIKHYVHKRYNKFLNDVQCRWPHYDKTNYSMIKRSLYNVLNHIDGQSYNVDDWNKFLTYTTQLDDVRGEDYTKSIPEIHALIEYYNESNFDE
jgi:MoaA/NifB/PqqE/SkfB family radical SAM enzyme